MTLMYNDRKQANVCLRWGDEKKLQRGMRNFEGRQISSLFDCSDGFMVYTYVKTYQIVL